MTEPVMHPVQAKDRVQLRPGGQVTSAVTLKAYEVYCELYGEQRALVTGGCRGGFSTGELVAFLYARSFPKAEWRQRAAEAFRGMRL